MKNTYATMNEFIGIIRLITSEEHISLVTVESAGTLWNTLVIDNTDTANYLREGNMVKLVCKESAVSIAKNATGLFSIRNRVACVISEIQTGTVLSSVLLAGTGLLLRSIITTNAVRELNLQIGDKVDALIKTTDISLLQTDV